MQVGMFVEMDLRISSCLSWNLLAQVDGIYTREIVGRVSCFEARHCNEPTSKESLDWSMN